ncbi:hypothetical protein D3C78_1848330 [compost metagenome]
MVYRGRRVVLHYLGTTNEIFPSAYVITVLVDHCYQNQFNNLINVDGPAAWFFFRCNQTSGRHPKV